MEEKYITVLDYSDGKIYQYENLEHFKDGWNGNDKVDGESIEWYLTEVKGHRLNDINWMAHSDSRIWTDYSETITN
tara:strand:+ start:1166 stop:1393 length:228 start_codon:yes stop_codon:yes gene_type:complete